MTLAVMGMGKELRINLWTGRFRALLPVMFTEVRAYKTFLEVNWTWIRFSVELNLKDR